MRRMGRAIAAELLPVLLILASLLVAWAAIVSMYRRIPDPAPAPIAMPSIPEAIQHGPAEPEPEPIPVAVVAPAQPDPPPDPTPAILERLRDEAMREREAAEAAGRRAESLADAARQAKARAESLRRRERIAASQVAELADRARALEDDVDAMARWRDILLEEREDLRRQVVRARSRDGFAVLPYKGPNGTWRRPIPIECRDGRATIQPGGPSFSLVELSTGFGRSSPLAAVIERYFDHIESGPSPDGAPVAPYVLFVVHPDGIRPYYEARSLLEALGIHFGYELVEQDAEIEYPDLDDPAEWSETVPLRSRFARVPGGPLDLSRLDGPSTDGTDPGGPGREEVEAAGRGGPPRGSSLVAMGGGDAARSIARTPGRATSPSDRSRPLGSAGEPEDRGATAEPRSALGAVSIPRRAPWPPLSRSLTASGVGDPTSAMPSGPGADRSAPSGSTGDRPGSGPGPGAGSSPSARSGGTAIGMIPPERSTGSMGSSGAGSGSPGSSSERSRNGWSGVGPETPAAALDLVVVCRPGDILIRPGGYRLSASKLGEDGVVNALRMVVRNRERAQPDRRWQPRVKFLVEPGGNDVYWEARRQTALSGLGWPVWLEVVEGSILGRLLDPEALR